MTIDVRRRMGESAQAALLFTLAAVAPAFADEPGGDETFPALSGEISIEIQNDWLHDAPGGTESNSLTTTIEPAFVIGLTKELSIHLGLTLEQVRDGAPGEDRVFDDLGLYASELTLNYETDDFSVFGGKFTPNFGIAWDAAPGVYGTDFAEDYELSERLGLGGTLTVAKGRFGTHVASASLFAADTSFLTESAFADRDQLRRWKGGPANTGSLESVAFALDGSEFEDLPGFRYHVGFAHQAVAHLLDDEGQIRESDGVRDEDAFAVGLEYALQLTDDVTVTPLVEWVRLLNAGGERSVERDYYTAALGASFGPWNAAASYTGRNTRFDEADNIDDTLYQISLGYAFDFGLRIDVGWKWTEEEEVSTGTAGLLVSYVREF